MARLNWTHQSIADLTNIANYIAKDSVRYAKSTVAKIRLATRQLIKYPLSGRKVPETDIETIREVFHGNYRIIYYIVSAEQVDIITVHHSSKHLLSEGITKQVS